LLKSADKAAPPASKRKKRLPATVGFIAAIRGQLDLESPLDAAIFACLTTTFYGAARLGEFTVKNLTSFDPLVHIKPADVSHDVDRNNLATTNFRVPRTKTSLHGENVFWAKQDGPSDPETAWLNHLRVNQTPSGLHLFAYRWKREYRPLTKSKFITRISQAAKRAGVDPIQGHGIRIGATLEYLLRGVPFDVMKAKGRWASDAFRTYLTAHAQNHGTIYASLPAGQ